MSSSLENYKFSRWFHTSHSLFQLLLVMTLFLGVNIFALSHFHRFDLTENQKYTLSPETVSYLRSLKQPIQLTLTYSSDSEGGVNDSYFQDIRNLVREYEFTAQRLDNPLISSEFINVFQQRSRAQELVDKYGLSQPNLLIVSSDNKHRVITPDEFYEMEGMERKAFKGEQVFTSAILDVSSPRRQTLYFLQGHEERDIEDVDPIGGFSQLAQELTQRNFELRKLDLTTNNASIPEDADLIIIAGPRHPLLAREVNLLKDYLDKRAGRVLVMLDPAVNANLGDLFYDWGVLADDMIVLDNGSDANVSGGDLLIRRFDPDHPITASFARNSLAVLVGLCRPIRFDSGAPLDDRLTVTPLLGGSKTSWGERYYRDENRIGFDPKVDLPGPVPIGVVAERRLASELGIDLPGGRLIVFGSSDITTNSRLSVLGNFSLFLNSVHWAIDRNNLLSIAPRPIDTLHITLSQDQMTRLRWFIVLLLPGITALFGLIVYWMRRS